MIVLITTFTPGGAANVGDLLIEESLRALLHAEGCRDEFVSLFREEPLAPHLDMINNARAMLMPGFAVRDTPMWPVTYRLTDNLDSIRAPIVPIGANYNTYPGDATSRRHLKFSQDTIDFLRYVADGVPAISCREWHTCEVLERNGVPETVMTGDPAWFDMESLGKPLDSPTRIHSVVFSPPLSPYYLDQAVDLMKMLASEYDTARRYCALHLKDRNSEGAVESDTGTSAALTPEVAAKNAGIRKAAKMLGFELLESAGSTELLRRYEHSDLHVGYECHAHIAFLRRRKPSVLIHEDARGVGYTYTLGGGGIDGFRRDPAKPATPPAKRTTSGYATTPEEIEIAPARSDLAENVRRYLINELDSGFKGLEIVLDTIDKTYEESMLPFLRSVEMI